MLTSQHHSHPIPAFLSPHGSTMSSARGLQLLPAKEGVAMNQFSFASNCDPDFPLLT